MLYDSQRTAFAKPTSLDRGQLGNNLLSEVLHSRLGSQQSHIEWLVCIQACWFVWVFNPLVLRTLLFLLTGSEPPYRCSPFSLANFLSSLVFPDCGFPVGCQEASPALDILSAPSALGLRFNWYFQLPPECSTFNILRGWCPGTRAPEGATDPPRIGFRCHLPNGLNL